MEVWDLIQDWILGSKSEPLFNFWAGLNVWDLDIDLSP